MTIVGVIIRLATESSYKVSPKNAACCACFEHCINIALAAAAAAAAAVIDPPPVNPPIGGHGLGEADAPGLQLIVNDPAEPAAAAVIDPPVNPPIDAPGLGEADAPEEPGHDAPEEPHVEPHGRPCRVKGYIKGKPKAEWLKTYLDDTPIADIYETLMKDEVLARKFINLVVSSKQELWESYQLSP